MATSRAQYRLKRAQAQAKLRRTLSKLKAAERDLKRVANKIRTHR